MRCHGLAVWLAAGVAAAGPVRAADPDPVEDALRASFRLRKGAATGTGFVVAVPGRAGGPDRAVLVTAAHVFDAFAGADCTLVLRAGGGAAGDRRDVTLAIRDGGKPRWVRHPDADVAALPVDLPAGADVKPFRLDQLADAGWAAGRRVRAGSDVVVPCFPAGVEANPAGWPVLRKGSIASHPLAPLAAARTVFVDYSHFGGDSGAPVVQCVGDRAVVVGLVTAMQRQTDRSATPFEERTVHTPLGLAVAVQSPLVREAVGLAARD